MKHSFFWFITRQEGSHATSKSLFYGREANCEPFAHLTLPEEVGLGGVKGY